VGLLATLELSLKVEGMLSLPLGSLPPYPLWLTFGQLLYMDLKLKGALMLVIELRLTNMLLGKLLLPMALPVGYLMYLPLFLLPPLRGTNNIWL
jgi:hypothetical protein